MKGMAIDINSKGVEGLNVLAGPRTSSTGWLESFGLARPVNNEDWHIQMSGTSPVADKKLVPNKNGSVTEVASGQTTTSGNDIDNISKENAKLKEYTKEIKKKTTNDNTEINETTNTNSASGSSDKNPYIQKSQGKDKNLADASPYLVKAQS